MMTEAQAVGNSAPVALFAFNRPEHLQKTISALAENTLARSAPVTAFADGPRSSNDHASIAATRQVLDEWAASGRFANFEIVASEHNKGLARSVIEGVSQVMQRFGRAIVLEDDLETAPDFLTFLNEALDFYVDRR